MVYLFSLSGLLVQNIDSPTHSLLLYDLFLSSILTNTHTVSYCGSSYLVTLGIPPSPPTIPSQTAPKIVNGFQTSTQILKHIRYGFKSPDPYPNYKLLQFPIRALIKN